MQASAAKLRELQERDLSDEDVVAVVLDGKTFADATMVMALGITLAGAKRFLGFVETDTENEKVLTPFLRSLVERGLDVSQGILVILDGGKGLRAAVRKAVRDRALVHRCQWHKRENVVSYLAKTEQASWRQRLQRAYNRPDYDETRAVLETLHREPEDRNQSAARSLAEGFDETLTLHRLGLYGVLGRSLKTTNCLESVNALVEERCAKVDHWQNSSQRHHWLATALLDIEPRLAQGDGVPALAYAPCRVEARTQDRHDDVEEERRVIDQEPQRVSTKNGLDSRRVLVRRCDRASRIPGSSRMIPAYPGLKLAHTGSCLAERVLARLRQRSERLERPNAHLYETGGMRRTHLRGHANILKRLLIHVGGFNLGLLLRTLTGIGTPRSLQGRLAAAIAALVTLWTPLNDWWAPSEPHSTDRSSSCIPRDQFELLPMVPSQTCL